MINIPESCKICKSKYKRFCRNNSFVRGSENCKLVLSKKVKNVKKRFY